MNCEQVKESLSAYIDDVLDNEEMTAISSHLHNCPACKKEHEALLETINMLAVLEEVIPPASFRRELRQKLEKAASSEIFEQEGIKQDTVKKSVFKPDLLWAFILQFLNKLRRSRLVPVALALVLMIIIVPPLLNIKMGSGMKELAKMESADDGFAENGANKRLFTTNEMMADKASQSQAPEMTLTTKAKQEDITATPVERKIIKNADLSLKVDDYKQAVAEIKKQVAFLGGYIANENVNNRSTGTINGHLQVRIPYSRFEGFLDGMEELGEMNARNIYSQDVTEEYVDIESRLKALRIKETRLLELLAKSGKLSEVLQVENELANTRAQLESLQGRLRYLDNRTDFSNVNINVQQRQSSNQQISPGGLSGVWLSAKQAFIESINELLNYLRKFIILIGALLPYLVIIAVISAGVWYYIKRKKGQ